MDARADQFASTWPGVSAASAKPIANSKVFLPDHARLGRAQSSVDSETKANTDAKHQSLHTDPDLREQ